MTASINAQSPLCLYHLLTVWAERTPDAPAIVVPGRTPLAYGRLRQHVDAVVQTLRAMGLSRHDRVALVLPNGPEMAVAFLSTAAGATCAPLNPAYGTDEFDFYLTQLHIQALLLLAGTDSPARAVAAARGLRIIELWPLSEAPAGLFMLTGERRLYPARGECAQPDDVALVLHTSGTTSQPKVVPLSHSHICAAAGAMRAVLELSAGDQCLNVLPLFHIYGLVGTLLTSLMAGASIVCTPGFQASQFFDWMAACLPTWYAGVPTMFQGILPHAAQHRAIIASCPLRLIRSGSAPLPRQLLVELERVFNVPVIEAYGMTETSSQIACNPLPPRVRKIGSVGIAAGPQVAIMDAAGTLLPAGETGEIVVRGASVIQAYENNPTANECAFMHGWFRTGDQGFLDVDGYLFITGRLNEIINCGGEKIAPQEVDAVLMEHPAVQQAVAFALPHARLGQEIAAAVILRSHAAATASDIRRFVATRLAHVKVPRQVFIVDTLPLGPGGKVQRSGLAETLDLHLLGQTQPEISEAASVSRTPVEAVLERLWTQVLDLECVDVHDDFFQLGGDSLQATQLLNRIREVMHIEIAFSSFFETPTVAALARSIETASWTVPGLRMPPGVVGENREQGEI